MTQRSSVHGPWRACTKWPQCKGKLDGAEPGAAVNAQVQAHVPKVSAPRPLGPFPGCTPLPAGSVARSTFALDPYQEIVAEWRHGTAVVAASAGSGKTTVLVDRTLRLLAEAVLPEAICLLAYNTDAAETLRDRLAARAGPGARRCNVFTFHAWCLACLRRWYPSDIRFTHGHILDTPGAPHPIKLVEPLLRELKLHDDLSWGQALRYAEQVSDALVDLNAATANEEIARALRWLKAGEPMTPVLVNRTEPVLTFAKAWQARKRREGLIQFSDMLGDVAAAIRTHPTDLGYLSNIYQHVMVDECQDTSLARAVVARHLGGGAQSVLWVGDTRQSIYMFTGARPDIMLKLAEEAQLLTLPVNRRSTRRIVEAANEVARDRDWNLGGDALPRDGAPEGEAIQVWPQESPAQEATDVITDIQRRIAAGAPMGRENFCILARTNAMLVDMEYAFVARGVPVRVAGSSGGVWGSQAGVELLTYLEGAQGIPTFGLMNVMNKPKRFGKRDALAAVIEAAKVREGAGQPVDLHRSMRLSADRGVQRFGKDLADLAAQPWGVCVLKAARFLGIDEEDDEEGEGGEDRIAALRALVELAQRLGSLGEIYRYKAEAARGDAGNSVLLSTIHRAKGQEYPVVYVIGVRVDKLPHKKCEDVEEERRLLYVAITRAQWVLTISTGGKASKFLRELGWVEDVE